jgi:hypothetical protein
VPGSTEQLITPLMAFWTAGRTAALWLRSPAIAVIPAASCRPVEVEDGTVVEVVVVDEDTLVGLVSTVVALPVAW